MQWLITSHVRRDHRHDKGSGHVWQERFKTFPVLWTHHVNGVETEAELKALRNSLERGTAFGDTPWRAKLAAIQGLQSSLRPHSNTQQAEDMLHFCDNFRDSCHSTKTQRFTVSPQQAEF